MTTTKEQAMSRDHFDIWLPFAVAALAGQMAQQDDSTYSTPNVMTLEQWREHHRQGNAAYCAAMADAMLAEALKRRGGA